MICTPSRIQSDGRELENDSLKEEQAAAVAAAAAATTTTTNTEDP